MEDEPLLIGDSCRPRLYVESQGIDDLLTCPICLEKKTKPKILSCHHSFCQHCLQEYWEDPEEGRKITCALCRKPTVVPAGGIPGLQADFYFMKMVGEATEDPVVAFKRRNRDYRHKTYLAGFVLLGLLMLVCFGLLLYYLYPSARDSGKVLSKVPTNRGMVHYKNNTILCVGDHRKGNIGITLIAVSEGTLKVVRSITVGMDPTNLKAVIGDELLLVDKVDGKIFRWSLPDLELLNEYPSVIAHSNMSVIGSVVTNEGLYLMLYPGAHMMHLRLSDMAVLDVYQLDPKYYDKGDYFVYLGPRQLYRGGVLDYPYLKVFNVSNGAHLATIPTDCYRRPYYRDGFVGSKGVAFWELRKAETLEVVLRVNVTPYLPRGRTLRDQMLRFGVYKNRYLALFSSYFGLIYDLSTGVKLQEFHSFNLTAVETNTALSDSFHPSPPVWMNDRLVIVGFRDNSIHSFIVSAVTDPS